MVVYAFLSPRTLKFYTLNLEKYTKEKDFEICALRLHILSNSFTIICIYRSPTGNLYYFLNQLKSILNKIHKSSKEIILCGDLNINYLTDTSKKHLLDSLLASFNLYSTVKFPTRITNTSCTLIDNIYINAHKHAFTVLPHVNGLSNHDAQILTLSNILIPVSRSVHSATRKIDSTSINHFILLLSYENWEDVFLDANVDLIFNNFLNTYLCLFYASFPIKKSHNFHKSKPWLTTGIRISCANKRKLSCLQEK